MLKIIKDKKHGNFNIGHIKKNIKSVYICCGLHTENWKIKYF
jgi:hypothetical protein